MNTVEKRIFLFLQGPHGPFFDRLGDMLGHAGCEVWRIGLNGGDAAYWSVDDRYLPFTDDMQNWPEFLRRVIDEKSITDIVLYGDTKPVHVDAKAQAEALGLTTHVFEEGYLRPYWVTYERGGANGHSKLMDMSIQDMRAALESSQLDMPEAPAHWGDMYQHMYYGFAYHTRILLGARKYPNFQTHRDLSVWREFRIYLRRFLTSFVHTAKRRRKTRAIKRGGFPYHIALLQLEHDSAFQMHSPFSTMPEFLSVVIEGFAKGAPQHHHLVFKAHPMESGRRPLEKIIREFATKHGCQNRVHYVPGGKLAQLLDHARTAVTVNSTAAQQCLWRGIPLKIFGTAVYGKPEFVSKLPLAAFFADPNRPDIQAYLGYRQYLLETSQIAGGFYSSKGRQQLLRQVVDMMLSTRDPYDAFSNGDLGPRQQRNDNLLRVVK